MIQDTMLQFRKTVSLPWNYVNLHNSRFGLHGHVWDYINARKYIRIKCLFDNENYKDV